MVVGSVRTRVCRSLPGAQTSFFKGCFSLSVFTCGWSRHGIGCSVSSRGFFLNVNVREDGFFSVTITAVSLQLPADTWSPRPEEAPRAGKHQTWVEGAREGAPSLPAVLNSQGAGPGSLSWRGVRKGILGPVNSVSALKCQVYEP